MTLINILYAAIFILSIVFSYQRLSCYYPVDVGLNRLLFSLAILPMLLSLLSVASMLVGFDDIPIRYTSSVGIVLILFFSIDLKVLKIKRWVFGCSLLNVFFAVLSGVVLVPFFIRMLSSVGIEHIDHDISLYFYESSTIAKRLIEGDKLWELIFNGELHTPHGIIYQLYLSWGFISVDNPGFTQDFIPKLLVIINQVSLFSAVLLYISTLNRINNIWFWIYASVIPMTLVWDYQFSALSRDTYYLTPIFLLLSLLQNLVNRRNDFLLGPFKQRLVYTSLMCLAIFFSIEGHSLGILYVSLIFLFYAVFLLFIHRKLFLLLFEVHISSMLLLLLGFKYIYKYIFGDAGGMGFVYPYYTDPVLLSNFEENSKFLGETNFIDFLSTIFISGSMSYVFFSLIVTIFLFSIVSAWLYRNKHDLQYLIISGLLIFLVVSLFFFPVDLDGINIRNAFVANFRYPMLLNLISVICVVFSIRVIIESVTLKSRVISGAVITLMLLLWMVKLNAVSSFYSRSVGFDESRVAISQKNDCDKLYDSGFRKVLIDSEGLLYRCPDVAHKLFSETGAQILSGSNDDEIKELIRANQVDGFLFNRDVNTWWSNVKLYEYLDRRWVKIKSDSNTIFVDPERFNSDE